jgi:hypothetical protein
LNRISEKDELSLTLSRACVFLVCLEHGGGGGGERRATEISNINNLVLSSSHLPPPFQQTQSHRYDGRHTRILQQKPIQKSSESRESGDNELQVTKHSYPHPHPHPHHPQQHFPNPNHLHNVEMRPLQKWELLPPSSVSPLNDTLEVPGFFPLRRNAPEENLTPQTIQYGYKELKHFLDVSHTRK